MKRNRFCYAAAFTAAMVGLTACSGSDQGETTAAATTAATTAAETAAPETSAGPQTYDVKANGYGGEVNLKVTLEDGAVTGIELGDNHESKVVIDRAFPVIRDRIIEAGTPVVDSVSGATFSSYAVKAAVADAMTQAGLEVEKITMATTGPEKEAVTLDDIEADILVVGGGPSGLAAAITAKAAKPDANIILVEKMDILSGNGKFDMNFYDLINSEAQKAAGNEKWTVNHRSQIHRRRHAGARQGLG